MSSACYVYAIVGEDMQLPAADSGVNAAQLTIVPWRKLAAVTEQVTHQDSLVTMDAVLRHEAIVEAVRRKGPALPVRFGTVFRDATAVVRALAQRYEPLAADLDRLGDKVELTITALWASDQCNSEIPTRNDQSAGFRYMQTRLAEVRRADQLKPRAQAIAEELDRVFGALALEQRSSLLPTRRTAVRTTYLLAPTQVCAFRAAFETVRETRKEVRVVLTGPWPPYTFVTTANQPRD